MDSMTTPPPPTRVRTPPTPLHGSSLDLLDSYSLRRSSRLNSKRNLETSPAALAADFQLSPPGRTPNNSYFKKQSIQTISPPSSPIAPRREHVNSQIQKQSRTKTTSRHDSDSGIPGKQFLPVGNMLPTPAKTPRKRPINSTNEHKSAARVLFPSRSNDADDIMPSPRKSRNSRLHPIASLDRIQEPDGLRGSNNIPIYTDSKERIPEMIGMEDDNPFLSRTTSSKKRSSQWSQDPVSSTSRKTKYGMTKEIDDAVDNNEGMVYVFRGKKVFRRFDDVEPTSSSINGLDDFANADLLSRAGAVSGRPFTRSSITPRVLFPRTESPPIPDAADEVDEEATTDIESPDELSKDINSERMADPQEHYFCPATPPKTARETRSLHKATIEFETGSTSQYKETKGKSASARTNPFSSWQRSKSTSRGISIKRHGESLERNESSEHKRIRGSTHLPDASNSAT